MKGHLLAKRCALHLCFVKSSWYSGTHEALAEMFFLVPCKKGGLFHCRFDKFYVATNPGFMVGSIVVSGSPTR